MCGLYFLRGTEGRDSQAIAHVGVSRGLRRWPPRVQGRRGHVGPVGPNPPHVAHLPSLLSATQKKNKKEKKKKPVGAILWTIGQRLQKSTASSQSTQCEMRS